MKSIIKILLYSGVLYLLAACAGQGGAAPDGSGASSVGGGQGQPTIAPGADHQPGIPVEDEDEKGPSNLTTPGEEPEEPDPAGFGGATDLKK